MGQIILRWVEEKLMIASDSHGLSIAVGRSPDPQHAWAGVKPSDLLLMAAAACSAYDVVDILSKGREPLESLKVICDGEQETEPPYAFTCVHLTYEVGGAVNQEKLARAVRLSEEKYCSVIATLRAGVEVTSSIRRVDPQV